MNKARKIAVLILAVVMILPLVQGCSEKDDTPPVLTYGDAVITEAMYSYLLSTYKGMYLSMFSDATDTDEFWDGMYGEETGEEIIFGMIERDIEQLLIAAGEFDRAGLELPESDIEEIDGNISSMTDELASGDEAVLDEYLAEYGASTKVMRKAMIMERKAQYYYDYLYGANGVSSVTVAEKEDYLKTNYVRFQQIYINDISVYERDKDGYYKMDEDGNYITRDLTEEERAEVNSRIAAVKLGLEANENFEALKENYSDSKDYPKGYYFSLKTSTDYITAVVNAAFSLEEGEWTYVEGAKENGTFFVKRLPVESGAYEDEDLADFFGSFESDLKGDLYSGKMEELTENIVKDESLISAHPLRSAAPNYYYY